MRMHYVAAYLSLALAVVAGADAVAGKVVGPDGKPVAGATVIVNNHFSATDIVTLATDQLGRFALPADPLGYQRDTVGRVTVYAAGFAVGGGVLKTAGTVIRLDSLGQAWGCVTDEKGIPVPRATVGLDGITMDEPQDTIWIPEPLKGKFMTRTTADGRWTILGVPTSGKAEVALADPRFVRARVQAPLGPDAVAAPALIARPGAVIAGRAVLGDGKPAAGVRVFAQVIDTNARNAVVSWAETTTSAGGYYKLTGLSTGTYNVMEEDPSGKRVAAALEAVKTTEGQVTRVGNLVLSAGAVVQGLVTDSVTGKPLPGVQVGSYGPHRPKSSAAIISSYTGKDGRYRLRVAPGKSYIYICSGPEGYTRQELGVDVTVGQGQTKELPFKLIKGVSLTGVAMDASERMIPDVTIGVQMVESASCPSSGCSSIMPVGSSKTNSMGMFAISGLPTGKARLTTRTFLMTSPEWDVIEPKEVELPASGSIKVTLRKVEMLTLTGRVVTPDGKPIGGATVKFQVHTPISGGMGLGSPKELSTDADGRFSLPNLRPDSKIIGLSAEKLGLPYAFTGSQEGKLSVTKSGYKRLSGGEVKKTGKGFEASDIVLSPLGSRLEGRVIDKSGAPVAGAKVASLEGDAGLLTVTDASGAFVLEDLPEGEVTVIAARGLAWGMAKAQVGGLPVTVALAEPARASGQDIQRGYRILEDILKESKGSNYLARGFVALELASYDPDLAVKLAQSVDGPETDVTGDVIAVLAEFDPNRAADWGIPKLDEVKNRHMFIYTATKLGIALAGAKPEVAADLYRRAKEKAGVEGGPESAVRDYASLAALAERLHNGEAEAMLDKALAALKSVSGYGDLLAQMAAEGSPELADKAISTLPEKERPSARSRAIQVVSRYDPRAALSELGKMKNTDDESGLYYGQAAKYVIDAIGKSDPAKALAIARGIQHGLYKAEALALAARYQQGNTAARVFREAADAALASSYSSLAASVSKIAAMVYDVDPRLGTEFFAQARERIGKNGDSSATFAFYHRLIDPAESRLMIETEFAELKRTAGLMNPGWSFVRPALAMAAIDVNRALEMANSISETETNARFDARRKIAQYVLAPESVRRTLAFDRWNASDTWIPGQPTGW